MPNQAKNLPRTLLTAAVLLFSTSACDFIQQKMGIEDLSAKEARLEADGKAVGGACRQSGRAIEDCYSIYSWLPKAPIYDGWRDMDAYMRDNKLETIEPQLPPVAAPGSKKKIVPPVSAEEPATSETTPTSKPEEKPAAQ